MKKINVSIMGGSGYTGSELLRLLSNHPYIEIDQITSRQDEGKNISDVFPFLTGNSKSFFIHPDKADFTNSDLIMFATPNGIAMKYAKDLLLKGKKIIDLAADFRIKNLQIWEKWYQIQHDSADLIDEAVYGLPEWNRESIKNAHLVANPGCYPTAIQLALAPLLKEQVIQESNIIIDAKSGISGAGRRLENNLLMSEASENFYAYAVEGHRHEPEIEENLKIFADNKNINVLFIPHLLPMVRGIYATIYADLKSTDIGIDKIDSLFNQTYEDSFFVDYLGINKLPQTKAVRGSNYCKISVFKRDNKLVILSTIDNLVKGAAGQAIQNMNLMFNFNENEGLQSLPTYP